MGKKIIALILVAIWSVIVLSGCNTIRGFGKDVEKAGEVIQKTAD